MARRPSTLGALALSMLAFAVVPAVAFVAFEARLARESEAALADLRDEQLDALLLSVNQHAWDVTNAWASRLQAIPEATVPGNEYAITVETWTALQAFFRSVPPVETVLSFDTTLVQGGAATERDDGEATADAFRRAYRGPRARRLLERSRAGYRQLDPVPMPGGRLALAFAVERAPRPPRIVALVVEPGPFVDYVVMPKLQEVARGGLVLGVFADTAAAPIAATGTLARASTERSRPLWLLPGYTVGVRPSERSAEAVGRRRRVQGLALLLAVTAVLGLGGVLAWRTVRKEVELARLREGFVSNVSHELRTPLAMIRLYAETLAEGRVRDDRRQHYVETIVSESERLSRLVDNVLAFGRAERGETVAAHVPLDVGAIAADVAERYRPVLGRAGADLAVSIAPGLPPVAGDADALAEALVNVLDNAAKYGGGTPVCLVVRAARRAVVVEVSDRGPGLAAADCERIFEPFVRVQAASRDGLAHTAKGTGLGLALVRRIATAHGGTVSAGPHPGGGALFRLTLPALSGAGRTPVQEAGEPEPSS